jgi:cellobiose-specific phosphotransferase system component IIC
MASRVSAVDNLGHGDLTVRLVSEGETASVSVAPVQGAIVRQVFTGWSGDITDTSEAASLTMDSPKVITANWRTDFVQLYMLIGGVGVVGGVVATVAVVRRRRQL